MAAPPPANERPLVMLAQPLFPEFAAALAGRYRFALLADSDAAATAEARVLLVGGLPPVTAEHLGALPALELVACTSVGVDHVDLDACRSRGLSVTNAGAAFAADSADYAVGLLVAVLRRVAAADAYVRSGRWTADGDYPLATKVSTTTTLEHGSSSRGQRQQGMARHSQGQASSGGQGSALGGRRHQEPPRAPALLRGSQVGEGRQRGSPDLQRLARQADGNGVDGDGHVDFQRRRTAQLVGGENSDPLMMLMAQRQAVTTDSWVDPMLCEVEASARPAATRSSGEGFHRSSPLIQSAREATSVEASVDAAPGSGRCDGLGSPVALVSETGQSWSLSGWTQGSNDSMADAMRNAEGTPSAMEMFSVELTPDGGGLMNGGSGDPLCTPVAGRAGTPTGVEFLSTPEPRLAGMTADEEALEHFRDRFRRPTTHVLPRPIARKPRTKRQAPSVLRRSSRLVGRYSTTSAIKRQQRALITRLQIAREGEVIGDDALQAYLALFNGPLGDDKITAILSLFGWEPEALDSQVEGLVEIAV